MNANAKTNQKPERWNNDDAVAEVSAAEAEAVAGGTPSPVLPPTGPIDPRRLNSIE